MEINKIGDVVIKSVEDYPVSEDNHFGDLSYFAPTIHEDYSTYIPPACYSIGKSAYVDFKAKPYINLNNSKYSPEYCEFGTDYTLNVTVDLTPAILNTRHDNAFKILQELYLSSNAHLYYSFPNIDAINIPRVTEKGGNPLIMESVNIIERDYGVQRFGLHVSYIELQPQARLPTGYADGDCGVTGELWARLDTVTLDTSDFKFDGRLYLSPEPEERAQGIFTGFIDVDIPVLCDIIQNEYDEQKNICGSSLIDTNKQILRARLTVKVNTFIRDGAPSTFTAYLFNNGEPVTKQFHGDYIPSKDGLVNDKSYYFEQINDTDFILMYRSAIMQSGDDNQPYYTLFAIEYYQNNNLSLRTIHATDKYSTQNGLYTQDRSPYDNLNSIETFFELVLSANLLPLSGGTLFYNNSFFIPEYNLTGVASDKFYQLNPVTPAARDGYYYTFNNGLYTALIDIYNQHLYLILADGSSYYDTSLSEYLNGAILNYVHLDSNNFILGVIDPSKPVWNPLNYLKFNFELIQIKTKPRVITYDFNKIGITFIPCHTHCMGKGGITSKV